MARISRTSSQSQPSSYSTTTSRSGHSRNVPPLRLTNLNTHHQQQNHNSSRSRSLQQPAGAAKSLSLSAGGQTINLRNAGLSSHLSNYDNVHHHHHIHHHHNNDHTATNNIRLQTSTISGPYQPGTSSGYSTTASGTATVMLPSATLNSFHNFQTDRCNANVAGQTIHYSMPTLNFTPTNVGSANMPMLQITAATKKSSPNVKFIKHNSYDDVKILIKPQCIVDPRVGSFRTTAVSSISSLGEQYKVFLRFCKYSPLTNEQMDSLPKSFNLTINDATFTIKNKYTFAPYDITTRVMSEKTTEIHIRTSIPEQNEFSEDYYFGVFLMKKVDHKQLLKSFKQKQPYDTKFSIDLVKKKLQEDDDDIIVDNVMKVSLHCPLSAVRIKTPARSCHCEHVHCFDAESFISINEITPRWKCPICKIYIKFEDLIIDGLFNRILQNSPNEANEAEIFPDGSFEYMKDGVKLKNQKSLNSSSHLKYLNSNQHIKREKRNFSANHNDGDCQTNKMIKLDDSSQDCEIVSKKFEIIKQSKKEIECITLDDSNDEQEDSVNKELEKTTEKHLKKKKRKSPKKFGDIESNTSSSDTIISQTDYSVYTPNTDSEASSFAVSSNNSSKNANDVDEDDIQIVFEILPKTTISPSLTTTAANQSHNSGKISRLDNGGIYKYSSTPSSTSSIQQQPQNCFTNSSQLSNNNQTQSHHHYSTSNNNIHLNYNSGPHQSTSSQMSLLSPSNNSTAFPYYPTTTSSSATHSYNNNNSQGIHLPAGTSSRHPKTSVLPPIGYGYNSNSNNNFICNQQQRPPPTKNVLKIMIEQGLKETSMVISDENNSGARDTTTSFQNSQHSSNNDNFNDNNCSSMISNHNSVGVSTSSSTNDPSVEIPSYSNSRLPRLAKYNAYINMSQQNKLLLDEKLFFDAYSKNNARSNSSSNSSSNNNLHNGSSGFLTNSCGYPSSTPQMQSTGIPGGYFLNDSNSLQMSSLNGSYHHQHGSITNTQHNLDRTNRSYNTPNPFYSTANDTNHQHSNYTVHHHPPANNNNNNSILAELIKAGPLNNEKETVNRTRFNGGAGSLQIKTISNQTLEANRNHNQALTTRTQELQEHIQQQQQQQQSNDQPNDIHNSYWVYDNDTAPTNEEDLLYY